MKSRISIAVGKNDNQIPNAAMVHISGQLDDDVGEEARRIKAEAWKKENREGMEEVAKFIARNGSFADENRNW
ncbi:antitoxin CcdA [Pectobacterium carotovorum subsp. carotovorum]|nr:antitoxin CcdA [Pectobacterium carotovorum subsp. carotovorum]GLW36508.1 antitoxin CcdA [Pectobacterium carotovorum subsp. carotovorum]